MVRTSSFDASSARTRAERTRSPNRHIPPRRADPTRPPRWRPAMRQAARTSAPASRAAPRPSAPPYAPDSPQHDAAPGPAHHGTPRQAERMYSCAHLVLPSSLSRTRCHNHKTPDGQKHRQPNAQLATAPSPRRRPQTAHSPSDPETSQPPAPTADQGGSASPTAKTRREVSSSTLADISIRERAGRTHSPSRLLADSRCAGSIRRSLPQTMQVRPATAAR